jgi:hypothetical protein
MASGGTRNLSDPNTMGLVPRSRGGWISVDGVGGIDVGVERSVSGLDPVHAASRTSTAPTHGGRRLRVFVELVTMSATLAVISTYSHHQPV